MDTEGHLSDKESTSALEGLDLCAELALIWSSLEALGRLRWAQESEGPDHKNSPKVALMV